MNKVKNQVRKDFTIIPNGLINDNARTDRARFLFCYMASKPDDWQFYQSPLSKELGYSVDTLRKYIKELIDSGWLSREARREAGKFDTFDYTLHPSPCRKNTDTVKNQVGKKPTRKKSALYNKDYNKEILLTKKEREGAPPKTETPTRDKFILEVNGVQVHPTSTDDSDFFAPNKHENSAAEIIRYLNKNPMYLGEMEKGDWQAAVKGHCLGLQKKDRWNALEIPKTEHQYYAWIGARIAGSTSWFKVASQINKQNESKANVSSPPRQKNIISEETHRKAYARTLNELGITGSE